MIIQVLHCPYCQGTDIVRHGKSPEGKQRYRCRECRERRGRTFLLDYSYAGQSPEVKEQIIDMAMNASGIRDTARVMKTPRSKLRGIKRNIPLNLLEASFGESHPKRLKISPTTVIHELKKRAFTPTSEPCGATAVESRASASGDLSG